MTIGWQNEFEKWMAAVNEHLLSNAGLPSEDLPDAPYADYFDSGSDPIDIADEVLIDAGLDP